MSPNSYKMEEFSTPQPCFVYLSYILASYVRKMVEKVLIPSMSMLRLMGMRKLRSKKMVKNMMIANIFDGCTLE